MVKHTKNYWKWLLAILFFFVLHFHPLNAQILTIDHQIINDGADSLNPFKGSVNLGIDYDELEGSVFEMESDVELIYNLKKGTLISKSQFDMTIADGERAIDTGFSQIRYYWDNQAKVTPELFLQFQWDGVRGMKSRWLEGMNLRWNVKQDSLINIAWGNGVFLEREVWDYRAVEQIEFAGQAAADIISNPVKFNSYFRVNRIFSDSFDAVFMTYLQFPFNRNFKYPRIAPSVQFNMKLFKSIVYSVTFENFYDFKPVVPIKKYTFSISNALVLEF